MKIYHNTRCSKSREALEIIKSRTNNFEIIEYLKKPLKYEEVKLLLKKLNIEPIKLIREKESVWKENYKGTEMNENEIINTIIKHPKLMERPIIEMNKTAIIGRPVENVLCLFNQEGI